MEKYPGEMPRYGICGHPVEAVSVIVYPPQLPSGWKAHIAFAQSQYDLDLGDEAFYEAKRDLFKTAMIEYGLILSQAMIDLLNSDSP